MWSLGTHENLLWPLFYQHLVQLMGLEEESIQAACLQLRSSVGLGCKYTHFQNKLSQKTQESAHKVACTGRKKTTPKAFTGVSVRIHNGAVV